MVQLKDLLTEFSFARDTDLSAALAALLTAAVRPSLAHAPMIHARAHMVGSGKSYLCELITAFSTGEKRRHDDYADLGAWRLSMLRAALPSTIGYHNCADIKG